MCVGAASRMMRRRAPAAWSNRTALVLALASGELGAQVLRGSVSEHGTGASLPGVVLELVDAQGRAVSLGLSDETGSFALRAPSPGRYALRAKRIGVRQSTTPEFELAVGETRNERLELSAVAVTQREVVVTGRTECVRRPGDDVRIAGIWEDARAALTATRLTLQDRRFRAVIERYVRELEPASLRVVQERRQSAMAMTDRPFRSAPAPELSRRGYVRPVGDSVEYFAPDAEALLSDEFLNDHCFRIRPGTRERANAVGLAFEPIRTRKTPDVQGVLWLDAATRELKSIEFQYTYGSDLVRSVARGQVSFARLPSGYWFVNRWLIRMPVVTREEERQGAGPPVELSRPREKIQAVREEGGEVFPTLVQSPGRGTVTGRVTDGAGGAGSAVAGVRVRVQGTNHEAMTDADGRYRIDGVPPGVFAISVAHARLDSLGVAPSAVSVSVASGSPAVADFALPSVETAMTRLCPDSARTRESGILRVVARDSVTRNPVAGFSLVLSWTSFSGANVQVLRERETTATRTTDAGGGAVFCRVPAGTALRLMVGESRDTLRVAAGALHVHDALVRPRR